MNRVLLPLFLGACLCTRAFAANISVTNTNDSGAGSLRQAITTANASVGVKDTISFNIPGTGLHTITPLSVLPTITDPLVIDGYTQPGSSPNTLAVGDNSLHRIELNGNGAAFKALIVTAGNSTVRGLVINNFNGNGSTVAITLQTNGGNTVQGCFLGLNAAGTAAATNQYGVDIESSPNNLIGGTTPGARNVIAGNNTGILVNGPTSSGTTIQGNYIGINAAGTAALTSGGVSQSVTGIQIGFNGAGTGSSNNTIGGTTAAARNVVSGNANINVFLNDPTTTGNKVQGNYIGINAAGTAAIGFGYGIYLQRTNNVLIGGTAAGAGNVISGNSGDGINLADSNSNLVQGNLIGTDKTGTTKVPNSAGVGILINGSNNIIGGTVAGARNVISGNDRGGIRLLLVTTSAGNLIQGNFIGTDLNGTARLGNGGSGIQIVAFTPPTGVNTVGGTTAAARNIISGNDSSGISGGARNVLIQGNFIGTDVTGTANLGNSLSGVEINGSDDTTVGGIGAGEGNLIAFNGVGNSSNGSGVRVTSAFSGGVVSGVGNRILGNSIHSNVRLGIDLLGGSEDASGVTANDPGDADVGANNLQNYPTLKSVTNTAGSVNITGTLNSAASKTFRLEFFRNDAIDPSGFGEGQVFLGSTTVVTNASGNASFNVNFPTAVPALRVSSTATDPNGNTSEFSAALGQLLNISTRLRVGTGENALIGGFIITGADPKQLLVRAIGPSLSSLNIPGALQDPVLELHDASSTIGTNDNWKIRENGTSQQAEIAATTIPPRDDFESALLRTLPGGAARYTAIVRGKNDTTGVGSVEVYTLERTANSRLANISTRGRVETTENVMIGGFIVGEGTLKVIVRAIGPSLAARGVQGSLQDPTLELHDGNGATIATNDNWKLASDNSSQQAEIEASTIPPPDDRESALVRTLAPGNYTAIVRGVNGTTGVALVEVYALP